LARLEGRLLLQELLARFPDWNAVDGGAQWDDSVAMHGLKSLTATFSQAA
jgi:cytochrome P450